MAGGLGFLLAQWAGDALSSFVPAGDIPMNTDRPWDWRVYVFTILASVAAGVVTGIGNGLSSLAEALVLNLFI